MAGRPVRDLRKKYPKLVQEIGGEGTVGINSVRSSPEVGERVAHSKYGYEPTAVDFIRRCKTEAQALEIIDFLEEKGELENDYAKRLRAQLAERGLRSFGKRKAPGCYFRPELS